MTGSQILQFQQNVYIYIIYNIYITRERKQFGNIIYQINLAKALMFSSAFRMCGYNKISDNNERIYFPLQPAELHGQGKPQEAGDLSTAHNAERPANTSQQKYGDGATASNDDEFNMDVEEAEGEDNGTDSRVKCPLSKITHISCAWDGALSHLQKHVLEGHAGMLRGGPTFQCKALEDNALLIAYREEVFLYRKRIEKDRRLLITVQPLGTTDNKYEYEVTIRSCLEQNINAVFSLRTTAEPNDDTGPDPDRWISIAENTWKMFSTNDELDMVVTIRENRTSLWRMQ
jgi:hypothetical protein